MAPSPKTIRAQMNMLQPLLAGRSLETIRKWQNRVGEMMEAKCRRQVLAKEHPFDRFTGAWVIPEDERREGVILYLHGGGFACGDLEYAKGFGSTLAARCGCKVFCPAYRLATEHPFPAALEDTLESYRYLLGKGYSPDHITLCGESAGGGLCFSLCRMLEEEGLPLPAGIIAISPWTDLTLSGSSYEENREKDASMKQSLLDYFADAYTDHREDPLVSPLLGSTSKLPPCLIFAGSDEIMRSDAERMHQKILLGGGDSTLVIGKDRWHGYLLYGLGEDQKDFDRIPDFLSRYMAPAHKLRWMPLDNAAKIYPAAKRQNWVNIFRVSATLTEEVDQQILRSALDVTVRRFPSIATRLRRGVFWYYLQQVAKAPELWEESCYPLTRMSRQELRKCAFRVIVYKNRIALEVFHSLTDGNGAMVFLKTLVAEYLQQKYGIRISATHGVLGRLEEPTQEELEDSFQKYAGPVHASRQGTDAFRPKGTPEPDGFLNLTCMEIPVQAVLEKAKSYGVSVTVFLCAAMMQALQNLQREHVRNPMRRKAIKVQVPVNLRPIFPSKSLRNFALYTTPEIDPRLGEYTLSEICNAVRAKFGMEVNAKFMSSLIATNVSSERIMAVKLMPLFIKNIVMKAVFNAVGERKSCLSLSNLGKVELPEEMRPYVTRMDFILGTQASAPHNCGVLTYGDTLYLNIIRSIREPELEYHFHCVLRDLGLPVRVQTNAQEE